MSLEGGDFQEYPPNDPHNGYRKLDNGELQQFIDGIPNVLDITVLETKRSTMLLVKNIDKEFRLLKILVDPNLAQREFGFSRAFNDIKSQYALGGKIAASEITKVGAIANFWYIQMPFYVGYPLASKTTSDQEISERFNSRFNDLVTMGLITLRLPYPANSRPRLPNNNEMKEFQVYPPEILKFASDTLSKRVSARREKFKSKARDTHLQLKTPHKKLLQIVLENPEWHFAGQHGGLLPKNMIEAEDGRLILIDGETYDVLPHGFDLASMFVWTHTMAQDPTLAHEFLDSVRKMLLSTKDNNYIERNDYMYPLIAERLLKAFLDAQNNKTTIEFYDNLEEKILAHYGL